MYQVTISIGDEVTEFPPTKSLTNARHHAIVLLGQNMEACGQGEPDVSNNHVVMDGSMAYMEIQIKEI